MSTPLPLLCSSETPPHNQSTNPLCQRTAWREVAGHYPEPRQCLATFLTLSTTEVLAGVKPANLLRIRNRRYPCGRNMYQLWQRYGRQLLESSPIIAATMRSDDSGVLLLIYSPTLLQRRLNSRSSRTLLQSLNYRNPQHIATTLKDLTANFVDNEFPHEIGLFLSYPLKDVTAFMGRSQFKATAQRLWKIYSHPRRSHALADLYQHQHQRVANLLRSNRNSSFQLLKGGVGQHG
ncbi:MAG: DUF3793 family protein [Deltaproteobacteria bacterium]|nr:DUF3793 family protein [Deltaproteobacteria bacterium]